MANERNHKGQSEHLPTVHVEDVEFSMAEADEDDLEALERAEAADKRQENA